MITRRTLLAGVPAALAAARSAAPPAPYGADSLRPPTRLARARVHRLPALHRQHLHRQGMGLRRRRSRTSSIPRSSMPTRSSARWPMPACAASSSPASTTTASACGPPRPPIIPWRRAVARRQGRRGARDLAGRGAPQDEIRRLPFALGSQQRAVRHARVHRDLPRPAQRTAHRLRSDLRGLARWRQRRRRLLRRRATRSAPSTRTPTTIGRSTWEMVRAMQPDAVHLQRRRPRRPLGGQRARHRRRPLLGDLRPGRRRWRRRRRPATCATKESRTGHRHGSKWLPAECDVSIRPGWFWHEAENARVKKAAAADRPLLPVGRPRRQPAAQRAAQSRRPDFRGGRRRR